MPLPKDFFEQLPHRSDSQLVEMLAHSADYEPEAIAAAEHEFRKRGISTNEVVNAAAASRAAMTQDRDARAAESWGWPVLLLFFILPCGFGFFGILLTSALSRKGYSTKVNEIRVWTLVGLVFWTVLAGLSYMIGR